MLATNINRRSFLLTLLRCRLSTSCMVALWLLTLRVMWSTGYCTVIHLHSVFARTIDMCGHCCVVQTGADDVSVNTVAAMWEVHNCRQCSCSNRIC